MKKFRRILAALISAAVVGAASVAPVSAIAVVFLDGQYLTQEEYEAKRDEILSQYRTAHYSIDVEEEYLTEKLDENGKIVYAIDPETDLYENLNIINNSGNSVFHDGGKVPFVEDSAYPGVSVKLTGTNEDSVADKIKNLNGVKGIVDVAVIQLVNDITPVPNDVEPLSGDLSMDGKVNIVDAVKLAKHSADPTAFPLLTYSQLAADINGDGELTNSDLVALIQII